MKTNSFSRWIFLIVLVVMASACNDRNAEKKIAELESRLKELEGKKAKAEPIKADPTLPIAAEPEVKPEGPLPGLQFQNVDHDFGTINEGDIVEHTFSFVNTGAAPLIIQNAQPSCG